MPWANAVKASSIAAMHPSIGRVAAKFPGERTSCRRIVRKKVRVDAFRGVISDLRALYLIEQGPHVFKKRLNHFLRMTEQNKQFGFGIDSYY